MFLYLVSFAADDSVYNDVVRFHVIANSDSEDDQAVKTEVRDMVLASYGSALSAYTNRDDALAAAQSMLSAIENDVNTYLSARTDYTCSVTIEESYFPTKTYGEYSLPRGNYTALCIRLGDSRGQNFWCVLFPPLCLGASSAKGGEELFINHGLSVDEYELMRTQKPVYKLKFRILELFR